jgi:hypothetical protein
MTGERCSECGLVIDREALRRSAFPWAHRRSVGRVRAFLKTVWLVSSDSGVLRQEAAKEQSARDGSSFRRWVAVALSASLLFVAVAMIEGGAVRDLVVRPGSPNGGGGVWRLVVSFPGGAGWRLAGWRQDLLVPWSAGVAMRPALLAYAVVLAFYLAGAPRSVLRTRGMPPDYAEAVRAIGGYASAPLVWMLPCVMGYALAFLLMQSYDAVVRTTALVPIVITVSFLVGVAGLLATVYRTAQWRARTTDHAWSTGLLAAAELLLRWALGCVVILALVPWCVGFVWIGVDSLR